MGECLITEVAALREENTRLRQCLEELHEKLSIVLGKDSPCIQKT